jgi:hypothetical protein
MADAGRQADKGAWVQRVLAFSGTAGKGGKLDAALGRWTQNRAEVIAQLRQLEGAIRAMQDPLGDPAIILVKAIAANLTAAPDSKQKVAELRSYLQNDSIIDDAELENGFGITVSIRAPLIPALDALDQALAA